MHPTFQLELDPITDELDDTSSKMGTADDSRYLNFFTFAKALLKVNVITPGSEEPLYAESG